MTTHPKRKYTRSEIEQQIEHLRNGYGDYVGKLECADMLEQLLASKLAAQKREGDAWRGIDTAPKTGEIIILGLIDDNRIMVREGRWEDARKTWTWPWVSGLSPNVWMSIPQLPSPDQDREVSP